MEILVQVANDVLVKRGSDSLQRGFNRHRYRWDIFSSLNKGGNWSFNIMLRKALFSSVIGVMLFSLACTRPVEQAPVAMTGRVSSDAEGLMEGVLVSAKGVGSTITVTVVSNEQGRYAFPRNRLEPGNYRLSIRAVGYDLDDPGVVDVVANESAEKDLKLSETQDFASQLMNAEWLLSVPGTKEQKMELFRCVNCHSLTTVVRSRHDADAWVDVLDRMRNYAPPSSLRRPQKLPYKVPRRPEDVEFAKYLASINLSSGTDGKWSYELKAFPRPKGRATKVIVTEYDLPRPDAMPHDTSVDTEGMVWYADFSQSYMGRLDPRTGEVDEWRVPLLKPGFPEGLHNIYVDKDGNPWASMLFQGGVARLDKKTGEVTTWGIPPEHNDDRTRNGMLSLAPDGTVWTKASQNFQVHKLDPKANRWTATYSIPQEGFYGMRIDSRGNYLYFGGMRRGTVGQMDTQTGEVKVYSTPTPNAGARRGDVDPQNRYWFAEFFVGKIGMFDPNTEQIQEWSVPTPWAGLYDVAVDKNGEVWGGGMHTDYISRLNPETGQVTEYLLPTLEVNIRRMAADRSTTNPVAVWIGENHQAKLAKIEPLESY